MCVYIYIPDERINKRGRPGPGPAAPDRRLHNY